VFLFDAGVWIAAKDARDPYAAAARRLVFDTDRPAAALDLTLYEVANVVGAGWEKPTIAAGLCRALAVRCEGRIVSIDAGLIDAGLEVVAEHGLSAYDAAYVAAARRHDWQLVSTDIRDLVSKGLAVTPDAADYP
jgi:predicted nucleic acid-binding protein